MREYIFRGFHPDENGKTIITLDDEKIRGEWVYGGYDFNKEHKRRFIVSIGIDNIGPIAYIQEVIPETVGQYVEMNDKNGNKIFEGNILAIDEYSTFNGTTKGIIRIYNGKYVSFYGQDILERDCYDEICDACKERIIISNIYENAELLEGE